MSRLAPQPVASYASVFFLVNATYSLLIWELVEPSAKDQIAVSVRSTMRRRSLTTLALFAIATIVALKFPVLGLLICCVCLVGYLRPDVPGAEQMAAGRVTSD